MTWLTTIRWGCPYCGSSNKISVEVPQEIATPLVRYCDVDAGGCDKRAVIDVIVDFQTVSHKIGGQE